MQPSLQDAALLSSVGGGGGGEAWCCGMGGLLPFSPMQNFPTILAYEAFVRVHLIFFAGIYEHAGPLLVGTQYLLKSTQISKGYLQGQETIELRLGNRKLIYIRSVFYSSCSQNSEGTRRSML